MLGELIKYISVFLLSTVKFFGGPVAGVSLGLSFFETVLFTITGMMTSVLIFSIVGTSVRNWYAHRQRQKNKPVFSKKTRRIVMVWQKFGISGIAFLTPILLSPIIGTIVATVLGAPKKAILVHMLWSSVIWGLALTFMVFQFRNLPFMQAFLH
ncbi:MAG: hypothetical protein LPJ89_02325 [Hymenobacteraceae bacterium]|nr:hypothetical protein [Hymenobacteraceae bacterium]MDX5396627.1 hypothetical protein [Hymenobacteraceae bacterium]MDX5442601.1 hypothetical protein [Hymenobacteraceae bacterium]MDX5512689.1 hypothetical protein [Hymenobacteraceae bacterium]